MAPGSIREQRNKIPMKRVNHKLLIISPPPSALFPPQIMKYYPHEERKRSVHLWALHGFYTPNSSNEKHFLIVQDDFERWARDPRPCCWEPRRRAKALIYVSRDAAPGCGVGNGGASLAQGTSPDTLARGSHWARPFMCRDPVTPSVSEPIWILWGCWFQTGRALWTRHCACHLEVCIYLRWGPLFLYPDKMYVPENRSLSQKSATRGPVWKQWESGLLQILFKRKIWGVMKTDESKPWRHPLLPGLDPMRHAC